MSDDLAVKHTTGGQKREVKERETGEKRRKSSELVGPVLVNHF